MGIIAGGGPFDIKPSSGDVLSGQPIRVVFLIEVIPQRTPAFQFCEVSELRQATIRTCSSQCLELFGRRIDAVFSVDAARELGIRHTREPGQHLKNLRDSRYRSGGHPRNLIVVSSVAGPAGGCLNDSGVLQHLDTVTGHDAL